MRENKFQVIERGHIVAVEFSDPQFNGGDWSHYLIADGEDAEIQRGGYDSTGFDPTIRRQYIGLHDKKGKEIYEGEKVIDEFGSKMAVRYNKDDMGLEGLIEALGGVEIIGWFTAKKSEVIGNIYEAEGKEEGL